MGIAVDSAGDLFIADLNNRRIRRVEAETVVITTVAGVGTTGFGGDVGPATDSLVFLPNGLAVDQEGNLFVGDTGNHRVRRIDAETGVITTVAGSGPAGLEGDGGPATTALLSYTAELDRAGNLFISGWDNHVIRRVDGITGIITTVAGTGRRGVTGDGGPATAALLSLPWRAKLYSRGNLFISDSGNHQVRKVDAITGKITTVAGSGEPGYHGDRGPAAGASFNTIHRIAVDRTGNLFISDAENHRIRAIAAP